MTERRPTAADLVRAVAASLRDDVLPTAGSDVRVTLERCVAVLDVAGRQLARGPERTLDERREQELLATQIDNGLVPVDAALLDRLAREVDD